VEGVNLLHPDLRAEWSILWPPTGPPRLYVSKVDLTREEIGAMVAEVIGLSVEWAASLGVTVSGTIAKPGPPE
jgi:hypothetical protein